MTDAQTARIYNSNLHLAKLPELLAKNLLAPKTGKIKQAHCALAQTNKGHLLHFSPLSCNLPRVYRAFFLAGRSEDGGE